MSFPKASMQSAVFFIHDQLLSLVIYPTWSRIQCDDLCNCPIREIW